MENGNVLYDFMTNAMKKARVGDACYKAFEDIFTAKSDFLRKKVAAGTPPNVEQLTVFMAAIAKECKDATSSAASASPIFRSLMHVQLHAQ